MPRSEKMRRQRFTERIRTFLISASIIKTIKTSHIVIIALLLVPLMMSIVVTFFNTISYDRLISNVDKTNRLNQVVRTEVTNELWDIVAGNKSFGSGSQYQIIDSINSSLQDIMRTTRDTRNRQMLEVAGRAMQTLTRYVNRLGSQMENNFTVIENERMLDEIRGVSVLVSELLQDFIVREIESAAAENQQIKTRAVVISIVEVVIIILAVFISMFVWMSVAKSVDRSIGSLVSLSSAIAEGNLEARAALPRVQELETLTENLNIMADKIKTLLDANIREQRNLQKSEMRALQAQITPHFLYNTMDSIVWLAEGNQNEQVISITRAFSDFFRISLNRGDEWVRVQDEFKHIESYLTIQKIRYRDILDYSIEYEREMEQKIMLKLLLQPLVENALYHGIKNKRGRGTISIRGRRKEGFLCFSVADNGIGMTQAQAASVKEQLARGTAPQKTGSPAPVIDWTAAGEKENRIYGLYNVAKRMELYYNRMDLLDIQSVYREGTTVSLFIPEPETRQNEGLSPLRGANV
ncbi:MAG: histidine kinase [Treponema sp.]|jgi:two-component system sensor histidine kinase YesM|nr:histidine kinase [Treponema sp.]